MFGDDYDTPDGTCIRDYIHVEDLADAHVKALDLPRQRRRITAVNVGTGTGSSVFDVINAAAAVAGARSPTKSSLAAPATRCHLCEPDHRSKTLGWSAQHGLDAIVQTAYEWHLSQLDGSR